MSQTPFQPTSATENADVAARTYPLDLAHPLVLDVANDAGNVVVRLADRADLLVRSSGDPDDSGSDDGPPDLRVVVSGNHVTVAPLGPHDRAHGLAGHRDAPGDRRREARHRGWMPFARWWMGRSVDVQIDIPARIASVNLTVVTASGNIDVSGVRGAVSVRTASGDIDLREVSAELRIDVASGDIRLGRIQGALQAQSASGDLTADDSRLERFRFRSASGDLALRGVALAPGEHRIDTASGDIDLALRPVGDNGAIGVAMTTMSGDARIGPGVTRLRGGDNAGGNGYGTIIRVRTMSGDLAARASARPMSSMTAGDRMAAADDRDMAAGDRVMAAAERISERSTEDVVSLAPKPPAPPSAPAPVTGRDAERLAILRSLEKGEISIEDATLRLDAVDAQPSAGG